MLSFMQGVLALALARVASKLAWQSGLTNGLAYQSKILSKERLRQPENITGRSPTPQTPESRKPTPTPSPPHRPTAKMTTKQATNKNSTPASPDFWSLTRQVEDILIKALLLPAVSSELLLKNPGAPSVQLCRDVCS